VSESSSAILIDPVLDLVNDYLETIRKEDLELKAIIDTHSHADHISGAAALKDRTDCEYIMHFNAPSQCVTRRVKDGDIIQYDEIKFTVLESNGHTMDSISLIMDDKLFTGDALFLDDGGAGRDDLPGGDPGLHWETLQRFRELPENLIVYPAHDYRNREPSVLAKQKQTNPHLKEMSKEEFVNYLNDLRLGPADWMKDVLKANYSCAQDPNVAWIPVDAPSCEIKGTLDPSVNEMLADSISAEQLSNMIKDARTPLMIDVREPHELRERLGQIEGVVNIPLGLLIRNLGDLREKQEEPIVLVCRSGARAYTAAQIMKKTGFKNPLVMEGGMIAWNIYKRK
jgi:glyoxylase-like metal-dependent hydrolase (beta-lactamase superfamily II)/rhodanese-related sulfurtransferase